MVDLPFAVSPIIAGLMLVLVYGPKGWMGRWLESGGLRVVYSWPGLVMATTFVTVPFVVREVVPVLRREFGIDQEEVARDPRRAGGWKTFFRRHAPLDSLGPRLRRDVPHRRPGRSASSDALLVVSGNILGRTQTATLFIHDGIESFHPDSAYAASVVLAGIVGRVLLMGMECLRKTRARRGEDGGE